MLSGEGNAGEWRKTTVGLISKKSNFARGAHFFCTFLCRCFARVQREISRNFLHVLWRKRRTCSRIHFFTAAHFHLALVAASISHILSPPLQNFHVVLLISRSMPLSPFFSLIFAGLPATFSFSLSFSCSIFQICGHNN